MLWNKKMILKKGNIKLFSQLCDRGWFGSNSKKKFLWVPKSQWNIYGTSDTYLKILQMIKAQMSIISSWVKVVFKKSFRLICQSWMTFYRRLTSPQFQLHRWQPELWVRWRQCGELSHGMAAGSHSFTVSHSVISVTISWDQTFCGGWNFALFNLNKMAVVWPSLR